METPLLDDSHPSLSADAASADTSELEDIGLVYATDSTPGISRIRRGQGFSYHLPDGTRIEDQRILARIQKLALPPAYEKVWINRNPKGHLQATGIDARGRKQYRYHEDWARWRSEKKFDDLIGFGQMLPKIRRRISRDLESSKADAPFLLSALISLLDISHMRVGNRAYARDNRTYGATTLQKRHLTFDKDGVRLSFVAKGGKRVRRTLRHPRLQKVLEEIADLPGRDLFSWRDNEGELHRIDSGRLNAYLAEICASRVSAKTFRTWGGSVAAFDEAWQSIRRGEHPTVRDLCERAAQTLHNTPAICRSSYIHPQILTLADKQTDLEGLIPIVSAATGPRLLRADEKRLMAFLDAKPPAES